MLRRRATPLTGVAESSFVFVGLLDFFFASEGADAEVPAVATAAAEAVDEEAVFTQLDTLSAGRRVAPEPTKSQFVQLLLKNSLWCLK